MVFQVPPFTVSAAIEILILTVVIYELLLLIRGAGAAQFLVWAALLAALYYGAEWGELNVISWLLRGLIPYLLFALVVLFQAEIRRWLAQITRNPFGTRMSSFEARQVIEDILMAVGRLAAQHSEAQPTGALIVLERENSLRAYTESGIPLQARLSLDLLVTIFQPGTPLHDGAVILRKDKVLAAACFLPLSVNPIWGTTLGTRHRAAVGITEETDAAAITVSEETGIISFAVSGSIELDISSEQLAERLAEFYGRATPPAASLSSASAAEEPAPTSPRSVTIRNPL